ncbi:MAG: lysophospholipid acyltransferase family protein [Marinifilaceae bacterium]
MRRAIGYIFTPFFYLAFGLVLLIMHPVQVICRRLGGYQCHKRSVDFVSLFLNRSLWVMGARISFRGVSDLPLDRPLIVVANHQSTYDIPAIGWRFRKHHPKFISKIELGKGIPSISYNLRHSGSALIDRKNGPQSIREIFKLGKLIEEKNYAACIFPEGTRSRNGNVKKFQAGGLRTLLKAAPSAIIVPFAIQGHYELQKGGKFPLPFGEKLTYTTLDPIEPADFTPEELVVKAEEAIKKALGQ